MDEQLLDDDRITLWGLFAEAYNAINRQLEADLKCDAELPQAWAEVLLRVGRSPGGFMTMTTLARQVQFSSGGFTKLADRMEADGLIERRSCPTDRRSYHVVLTDKGNEVLDRILTVHLPGLERHFTGHLSARERGQLERLLRKLRDAEAPGSRP